MSEDQPALLDRRDAPLSVLVLDDLASDRERLVRLCEAAGLFVEATEAATLREFRSALDAQSYGLVFIDYLLAGETGLDAVDMLLAHPRQSTAAAIMFAGEGRIDIAVAAMRRGCADYLTKSELTVDSLRRSVATAIERRLLASALSEEREKRIEFERATERYLDASRAEMRSILAAVLRRLRDLRGHAAGDDGFAADLRTLEDHVDLLWDTLPDIRALARIAPKRIAAV